MPKRAGNCQSELGRVKRPLIDVPLSDYFTEEYFKTKELIYVKL